MPVAISIISFYIVSFFGVSIYDSYGDRGIFYRHTDSNITIIGKTPITKKEEPRETITVNLPAIVVEAEEEEEVKTPKMEIFDYEDALPPKKEEPNSIPKDNLIYEKEFEHQDFYLKCYRNKNNQIWCVDDKQMEGVHIDGFIQR